HVTEGMDIVDAICANTVNSGPNGAVAPEDQPVITEVRVIVWKTICRRTDAATSTKVIMLNCFRSLPVMKSLGGKQIKY
ncbi:MAG: hypothetical protein IIZ07_02260, partial [Ruminococcus sp.]|nr:hypothetical protein [Ruminococcus sp.]